MTRWAKVPEWLLDALTAQRKPPTTPGNALLAYTVLSARFADWHTHIADATQGELAVASGLSRSTAGRCIETLEGVRALDVLAGRAGWRGRSRFLLALDAPLPTGEHRGVTLPTGGRALPTGEHLRAVESAGQSVARCSWVGSTTQIQESSPEGPVEDVWGLLEEPSLFIERDPDVVRWLRDRDRRLDTSVATDLPALRAASPARGPRAPVRDVGGTDGTDAGDRADGTTGDTTATGAGAR